MIKSFKRASMTAALVVVNLSMLSACFPLVMGGAVVTGMVATDRRTTGTVVEDEGIELRSASRIRENMGDRAHINITSYNRQVVITGEVPSAQDKQLAEQIVLGVDNVRHVVNELAVLGNSTFAQRSSDSLVSGRVKAALLDAKDLYVNAFKITTERGTVYMMGRVTTREATRATEVISATTGVQKVVRILETISEEELKRLTTTTDAPEVAKP